MTLEEMWIKRVGPHCVDCRFYEEHWTNTAEGEAVGGCHRFPPKKFDVDEREARFPLVAGSDWCGEFRLSDEKAEGYAKHIAETLDGKP